MLLARHAATPASTVGLGAAVFAVGATVYLFDRPDVLVPGLGPGWNGALIGSLSDFLPSFAHTFAFTIWISVAVGGKRCVVLGVAVAWATLESLLELAQSPGMQPVVSLRLIGITFGGIFDPRDLAAVWIAGALAAALVIQASRVDGTGATVPRLR